MHSQLSQELFYWNGTIYNQSLILNDKFEVDPTLITAQGLPYYAGTWTVYLLSSNMALAATFTHLLLWNRDDLRSAWSWMNMDSIKQMWKEFDWRFWKAGGQREAPPDADIDPHYREMLKVYYIPSFLPVDVFIAAQYPDAPNSWYSGMLVFSFAAAWMVLQKTESTLPWWV